jgi:hypothetical protein
MSFVRVLVDSFILLKRCPRFFIPKILVAFLFLPIIILSTIYVINYNVFSPAIVAERTPTELTGMVLQLAFLLIYTFIVYFVDSFLVNPMYPVMVKQYYKDKKIDFRKAFVAIIRKFGTIFTSLLIFSVLLFAVMLPFIFLMVSALLLESEFLFYVSIGLAGLALFAMLLFFYLIYPVSSTEQLDFAKALKKTVTVSFKHKKDVLKALFISFIATGLSYIFSGQMVLTNPSSQLHLTLLFFALVILARFLVAVLATYQYVLNAVFYFGFEKGVFLGKKGF